jgi:hypothetical protein
MSEYPGFPFGAQNRMPCSVSTSRSSNRTGGFPASGSPTGFARRPTKRRDTAPSPPSLDPSAGSESLVGGYRQHGHSPDSSHFQTAPEVRSLPSAGITRFPRYYEPLRHPTRPGLSLAGVRLVLANHRWGFPCFVLPLCLRAVASTPVGPLGARVVLFPSNIGLHRRSGGSAPTDSFSRPAQRSLTLRPTDSRSRQSDPFHRRLWQSRYLHCHFNCYRLER